MRRRYGLRIALWTTVWIPVLWSIWSLISACMTTGSTTSQRINELHNLKQRLKAFDKTTCLLVALVNVTECSWSFLSSPDNSQTIVTLLCNQTLIGNKRDHDCWITNPWNEVTGKVYIDWDLGQRLDTLSDDDQSLQFIALTMLTVFGTPLLLLGTVAVSCAISKVGRTNDDP